MSGNGKTLAYSSYRKGRGRKRYISKSSDCKLCPLKEKCIGNRQSQKTIDTQLEPGLFKKVTGLNVKDFELLCSIGVFNASLMNDAIFKFKRYEDASLSYLPASRANKEKYIAFINSLGLDTQMPVYKSDSVPEKLTKAEYPEFIIERTPGFRSFVAYDVETTGLIASKDDIIEIGAVRVRDGIITEQFQTFVNPYKKGISERITELTGITKDMVKDAPKMWDAFNTFADFIGDDIVIGYNNTAFDNKFMMRAGRYAKRTLNNRFFDVLTYVRKHRYSLDCDGFGLGKISHYLGIANPREHRALADAETTAKVYLALLERFGSGKIHSSPDEQLDEEWV